MYFFDRNEEFRNNIICIDDTEREYTYEQIWDMGDEKTDHIARGSLVLMGCRNDAESLSTYLALLRKGCPVILMGQKADTSLVKRMAETYKPDMIIGMPREIEFSKGEGGHRINKKLALLLSTSGSTGAQKLVRLSRENLQSNCDSIVEYLELNSSERPVTTLPMEYTYGLSVIHSHVAVGATIILTERTLFESEFWELVKKQNVTSMAGVPYTYEMLNRLRITEMELPALKTMTQAGGHLKPELQEKMARWAADTGRRFFVMYGQTEATARMSYVPPERCLDKTGSIGIPVPGGRIELADDGEMIYYGKNVSLGYATCITDLEKGDENGGRLETGDIACRDEEGYLYITGRKKRFIKLQGKRISLDQIQDVLQEELETDEIVCTGEDDIGVKVWTSQEADEEKILDIFAQKWDMRSRMVSINRIERIPRNASGKIIYADLK